MIKKITTEDIDFDKLPELTGDANKDLYTLIRTYNGDILWEEGFEVSDNIDLLLNIWTKIHKEIVDIIGLKCIGLTEDGTGIASIEIDLTNDVHFIRTVKGLLND